MSHSTSKLIGGDRETHELGECIPCAGDIGLRPLLMCLRVLALAALHYHSLYRAGSDCSGVASLTLI